MNPVSDHMEQDSILSAFTKQIEKQSRVARLSSDSIHTRTLLQASDHAVKSVFFAFICTFSKTGLSSITKFLTVKYHVNSFTFTSQNTNMQFPCKPFK